MFASVRDMDLKGAHFPLPPTSATPSRCVAHRRVVESIEDPAFWDAHWQDAQVEWPKYPAKSQWLQALLHLEKALDANVKELGGAAFVKLSVRCPKVGLLEFEFGASALPDWCILRMRACAWSVTSRLYRRGCACMRACACKHTPSIDAHRSDASSIDCDSPLVLSEVRVCESVCLRILPCIPHPVFRTSRFFYVQAGCACTCSLACLLTCI
jgi:hypothetical protein